MVEPVVAGAGKLTMKRILAFLASDGAFLYEDYGCVIVQSEYVDSFGGTGSVTLRTDPIELRLWLERDRLFLDVRGIGRSKWFSMDIIYELLTGRASETGEMNNLNTECLRDHFDELRNRFVPAEVDVTEKHCGKLEKNALRSCLGSSNYLPQTVQ